MSYTPTRKTLFDSNIFWLPSSAFFPWRQSFTVNEAFLLFCPARTVVFTDTPETNPCLSLLVQLELYYICTYIHILADPRLSFRSLTLVLSFTKSTLLFEFIAGNKVRKTIFQESPAVFSLGLLFSQKCAPFNSIELRRNARESKFGSLFFPLLFTGAE
jgi:hypothetical protein